MAVGRVVADASGLLRVSSGDPAISEYPGTYGLEQVRARVDAHLVDLGVRDE
jgi:hypothetical protein